MPVACLCPPCGETGKVLPGQPGPSYSLLVALEAQRVPALPPPPALQLSCHQTWFVTRLSRTAF